MAKFIMDDEGRENMSSDKFMMLYERGDIKTSTDKKFDRKETYIHIPFPTGRLNCFRINAISTSDLLKQIQNNWDTKCVVSAIKGERHECLSQSDIITKKISEIVKDKIDSKVRNMCPKKKDETDEEYEVRLLYWYMEKFYPKQLKEIRCTECLNHWLNTNNW